MFGDSAEDTSINKNELLCACGSVVCGDLGAATLYWGSKSKITADFSILPHILLPFFQSEANLLNLFCFGIAQMTIKATIWTTIWILSLIKRLGRWNVTRGCVFFSPHLLMGFLIGGAVFIGSSACSLDRTDERSPNVTTTLRAHHVLEPRYWLAVMIVPAVCWNACFSS